MTTDGDVDQFAARLARGAQGLLRDFNQAGVLDAADAHVAARVAALGREPDDRVRLALALAVRAVRLGSVCMEPATIRHTVTVDPDAQAGVADLPWPDPGAWATAIAASRLVTNGPHDDIPRNEAPGSGPGTQEDIAVTRALPATPLRYTGGLLYLDRYWREEQLLRRDLTERISRTIDGVDLAAAARTLDRLFADGDLTQRSAAAMALTSPLTVVTGGPGTGKTATVARIVAALLDQPGPGVRVALVAPTGKAAARLQGSVATAVGLSEGDRRRLLGITASTIHRLLGSLPGSRSRFRHGRDNRLPYDVVIVDETSMVSLTLMARLLEAMPPQARLILVGDPDQLASVEAGAVLGDIVAAPRLVPDPPGNGAAEMGDGGVAAPAHDHAFRHLSGAAQPEATAAAWRTRVVRLSHVYRTDNPAIDTLAAAIRVGDPERVMHALRGSGIEFVPTDQPQLATIADLQIDVVATGRATHSAALAGDAPAALAALTTHRVLCAHRDGRFGVSSWASQVQRCLRAQIPGYGSTTGAGDPEWYTGRPIVVTTNDYELQLFNGETGVAIRTPEGPLVAFVNSTAPAPAAESAETRLVAPSRLSFVLDVYAMTVHRAQGSEFDAVTVVLPEADSPLLTRELLYTAVTRAKSRVRVLGTPQAVEAAVRRPIVRATGLRRVW